MGWMPNLAGRAHIQSLLVSVESQANSSHRTSPCHCVPSLGVLLLRDIILTGGHDAPNWFKCIVGAAVSGQSIIAFGTSTAATLLMGQDSNCITQMGALGCVGSRVRGTMVSVRREQMVMSVHLSSYGPNSIMMASVSWLCWMAPWIKKEVYRRVLQQSHLPWVWVPFYNKFALVQNNALFHTAQATRDFLENQNVELMDWPSKRGI